MTTTLGQRLRELREKADLSLRELARKIDVSAAFLSDVELGRRFPSGSVLVALARELRTTSEELRAHDTRPALDELKRLASENPKYGFAFRTIVERGLTPEDLMALVKQKADKKKKR